MSNNAERIIAGFEHLETPDEIKNHLFRGTNGVIPGCWISADTVCADVQIGGQGWPTYSVPVMAYLVQVENITVPGKARHQQEILAVEGYSNDFYSSAKTEVALGKDFNPFMGESGRVRNGVTEGIHGSNARVQKVQSKDFNPVMGESGRVSNGVTEGIHGSNARIQKVQSKDFNPVMGESGRVRNGVTEGIHGSNARAHKVEVEGPGGFSVYQLHIAHAHCATSAADHAGSFKYAKTLARPTEEQPDRVDLYFMTSIATDTLVPVSSEHCVPVLSWEDIQEAALMKGYDPETNEGLWSIDFTACDNPGVQD
ncbi:hypothetical protein [Pseudomonas farsensis]|uniref:Uncharacterized protein n=1 Tax=Pseudomonas farsensis TaxID=2745492 RepID=A0ABU8QP68_9PSED